MSASTKRAGSYNVATRGKLLDSAEELFAARSHEAVTLKEIAALAEANCLIIREANAPAADAGAPCKVLMLR